MKFNENKMNITSFIYLSNDNKSIIIIGPQREKICLWRFANNTSAQSDQRLCYSLIGKYHIYTYYERMREIKSF